MSIEITLSHLRACGFADHAAFEGAVDAYIAAREVHCTTIGEPRPAGHPLVEAAVVRYPPPPDLMPDEDPQERFVREYTFVDDTPPPPPPPTLEQRKEALAQQTNDLALAAAHTVWPPLTRRLLEIKGTSAQMVAPADRTPEQEQVVAEYAGKLQKLQNINLHLAEMEIQIHNLTDETIDGWQPGPFPT